MVKRCTGALNIGLKRIVQELRVCAIKKDLAKMFFLSFPEEWNVI